ncbi:hypothetical protein ACIGXA_10635 [Streptomyces fildesensis]|uniref:Uncharacterized protein n=1 Tax=Streptomyces fildesensis TaxID=375757 RepID=A0ABW8C3G2_9ACTN
MTAGKAVFHAEYAVPAAQLCPTVRRLRLTSMLKHLNVDAWREPCWKTGVVRQALQVSAAVDFQRVGLIRKATGARVSEHWAVV